MWFLANLEILRDFAPFEKIMPAFQLLLNMKLLLL